MGFELGGACERAGPPVFDSKPTTHHSQLTTHHPSYADRATKSGKEQLSDELR
jgi:hypothetical protein